MADVPSEVERLRAELETYRLRELQGLRDTLAAVVAERDHYKAEAYRNADIGRQIHQDAQAELTKLRTQLEVKQQTERAIRNANARRN